MIRGERNQHTSKCHRGGISNRDGTGSVDHIGCTTILSYRNYI